MRLKNRQLNVPNGFSFYIPQLKWSAPPYSSIDFIARAVINLLQANPQVQRQLGWDLSIEGMSLRVEEYNAAVCLQMGHLEYVLAEGGQPEPPPFLGHQTQNPSDPGALAVAAAKVKAIWAGIKTLNAWEEAGYPAVPQEQSESRAAVCAVCPKNGSGGIEAWFTRPAAEAIRRKAETFTKRGLFTSHDHRLNVCEICWCPMRLKVHTPISFIKADTSNEVLAQLQAVPGCWVAKEIAG